MKDEAGGGTVECKPLPNVIVDVHGIDLVDLLKILVGPSVWWRVEKTKGVSFKPKLKP